MTKGANEDPKVGESARVAGNPAALLALAGAVCTGFAGLGSGVVVAFEVTQGGFDTAFLVRTALKAAVFSASAAVLLWIVRWTLRAAPNQTDDTRIVASRLLPTIVGLAAMLLIAPAIAFPALNDMPRAEPDELHHLIVAKNLGLEGRYASGTPGTGYQYFDSYDSVGAPVILPAALALRWGGVDVGPPRQIIAAYFCVLVGAAYLLVLPWAGAGAAAFGAVLLALAPMSPYLARTLYGEVPGLAWILVGLLLWRASWTASRPWAWGIASGVAFALAVLCKAYLILFALAAGAAFLHDRWSQRRIPVQSVVAVVLGGGIPMALWVAFTLVHGEPTTDQGGTLAVYRHLLLFGVGSTANALLWFIEQPMTTAGVFVSAITTAGLLARRMDPAILAAWLFAVFVVFWFLFFTPGHIPRYLWYGVALFSLFFGPAFVAIGAMHDELVRKAYSPAIMKPVVAFALLLLLSPYLFRNLDEMLRMYTGNEMAHEREIAAFVARIPEDKTVSTAFWPLERVTSFYLGEPVPRVRDDAASDFVLHRARRPGNQGVVQEGRPVFHPEQDPQGPLSGRLDANWSAAYYYILGPPLR